MRTRRCSESESNARHAASSSSVVNDTAHQHPSDLGQGDEDGKLPGDSETRRSQGLVRVHHGVHAVVHSHELTTPGNHVLVGVPRVQEHSDVVVPVQEDQLLLPQNDEYCISQFRCFA